MRRSRGISGSDSKTGDSRAPHHTTTSNPDIHRLAWPMQARQGNSCGRNHDEQRLPDATNLVPVHVEPETALLSPPSVVLLCLPTVLKLHVGAQTSIDKYTARLSGLTVRLGFQPAFSYIVVDLSACHNSCRLLHVSR